MANLLVTDICNRSCPYCFALKETGGKGGFISWENLKQVVGFLKSSEIKDISLLGGEPTLHPEFSAMLNYTLEEGFRIKVFSNALMRPEVAEALAGADSSKFSIVINVNHPNQNPPAEWARILEVLEKLSARVTLGYNIYQPKLELDFLLELVEKYGLYRAIRLGIAQPVWGEGNAFIPLEEYFAVGPKVVAFTKECDKYNIRPYFDCGFILCMFSELELGQLYCSGAVFSFYCTPAVDFGLDLDLWHCFPLSKCFRRKLAEFTDYKEIWDFYIQKFQPLRLFGALERCAHCRYLQRQQCSGGCLAHKLRVFHMEPTGADDQS